MKNMTNTIGMNGLSKIIQLKIPPLWYEIISCMLNELASIITVTREIPAGIS